MARPRTSNTDPHPSSTDPQPLREHWSTASAQQVARWHEALTTPDVVAFGMAANLPSHGAGPMPRTAKTVREIVTAGWRIDRADIPTPVRDTFARIERSSGLAAATRYRIQNSHFYADEERAIRELEHHEARGYHLTTRAQEAAERERERAARVAKAAEAERQILARAAELAADDEAARVKRFIGAARLEAEREARRARGEL